MLYPKNSSYLNRVQKILVEEYNYNNNMLTGRNENNILVHFHGSDKLVGEFVNVKIIESKPFYLIGEITEDFLC